VVPRNAKRAFVDSNRAVALMFRERWEEGGSPGTERARRPDRANARGPSSCRRDRGDRPPNEHRTSGTSVGHASVSTFTLPPNRAARTICCGPLI
jgi:hypothetical protein